MQHTPLFAVAFLAACTSAQTRAVEPPVATTGSSIQRSDVATAQRAWCDSLLSISAASRTGDPTPVAERVLSTAYDYDRGPVLFKPTLTHGEQTFRMDKRGALAYFVGGDTAYPDDTGFARKPWTTCEPEVVQVISMSPTSAIAMGNVTLVDSAGNRVKVNKTFGYRRAADGNLRIVLHHSSLAYTPPTAATASR